MSEPGPYRRSAREPEPPPERSAAGFVTWAGAIVVLVVIGAILHAVVRAAWGAHSLDAASQALAPALARDDVRRIAAAFDPREQPRLELAHLAAGEAADGSTTTRIERDDDAPAIEPDARGIVVHGRRRLRLDAAHVELGDRAAASPDDVRWIAIVHRETLADLYRYEAVAVDVEVAHVAVVDLASERRIARIAVEAAPPPHTQRASEIYRVAPEAIADAIAQALRAP